MTYLYANIVVSLLVPTALFRNFVNKSLTMSVNGANRFRILKKTNGNKFYKNKKDDQGLEYE